MKIIQSGRNPIQVYLYNNDGKYIRHYESISVFSKKYGYPKNVFNEQYPSKDGSFEMDDGKVASTYRIGRVGVKKLKEYNNSPFVGHGKNISITRYKTSNRGSVIFYDLDGDKIAEFKSIFQAALMTGIQRSTFDMPVNTKRKMYNGLIFEIKPLI